MEVGIPGHDASDPVLPDQRRSVQVVHQVPAGVLDQAAAGRVELGVGVGCIQQYVGVDDEHGPGSAGGHSIVQRFAIRYVNQGASALPEGKRLAHPLGCLLEFVQ